MSIGRVAALFVDPKGIYPELLGRAFCWANEPGYSRDPDGDDARLYTGSLPVVAHPTCSLWVNFAASNYARAIVSCKRCGGDAAFEEAFGRCRTCNGTGRREPNRKVVLPAWYPGGDDGGCFASALANVRGAGGCLEHPASTHAWKHYGLEAPERGRWTLHCWENKTGSPIAYPECAYWTCEVSQGAYGHPCRKLTWLLYCGKRPPFDLRWDRSPGTHQIGFHDKRGKAANKPTISGKAASATPRAFAEELIRLAEWSQG